MNPRSSHFIFYKTFIFTNLSIYMVCIEILHDSQDILKKINGLKNKTSVYESSDINFLVKSF